MQAYQEGRMLIPSPVRRVGASVPSLSRRVNANSQPLARTVLVGGQAYQEG